MKVTVHATLQSEPFLVNGTRVLSGDRYITILDIRQPHEDINNGITFIMRDAAQLRDLILAMVEACEKVQKEEIAEQDAALRAKIHAVLDARVALRAQGLAPGIAPSREKIVAVKPEPEAPKNIYACRAVGCDCERQIIGDCDDCGGIHGEEGVVPAPSQEAFFADGLPAGSIVDDDEVPF